MKIQNPQKFLEQHFPTFTCSLSFHEISFLFEVNEAQCGGDDVSDVPCGFILRSCDDIASALFMRDFDAIVFHGLHLNTLDAHEYACDRLIMELFQSDFVELVPQSTLSTESVDN
jgi:hypothetical protein